MSNDQIEQSRDPKFNYEDFFEPKRPWEDTYKVLEFIPAEPGWSAVFVSEHRDHEPKAVAMWAVCRKDGTLCVVGMVGDHYGNLSAAEHDHEFAGYEGPERGKGGEPSLKS